MTEDANKLSALVGLNAGHAQAPAPEQEAAPEQEVAPEQEAAPEQDAEVEAEPDADAEQEEAIAALADDDLNKTITLANGDTVTVQDAVAGYMRNNHHTQSLQSMAETRSQYARVIDAIGLVEQAGAEIMAPDLQSFQNVNMEQLAASNPQEYARLKPIRDALMQRHHAFKQRIGEIAAQLEADIPAAEESTWKQIKTDLGYSIPGFSDKSLGELQDYTKKAGFTEREVAMMADARILRIIDKAKRFDDLKGKGKAKAKAVARPGGKPATGKPASASGSREKSRLVRAARKGSRDANIKLLKGLVNI